MVGLDPTDDILCKRLFEAASRPNPKMGTLSQASLVSILCRFMQVQNTRGAYYLGFEQVVELLQILKKGDTLAKAGCNSPSPWPFILLNRRVRSEQCCCSVLSCS